jgi:hypothetical protein
MGFTCFFRDRGDVVSLPLVEGGRSVVRHILGMSGAGGQLLKRLLEGDKNGE